MHLAAILRTNGSAVKAMLDFRLPSMVGHEMARVPTPAVVSLHKVDSLEVKVRALLAERLQRIGYEKQLEAAASSCR